MSRRKYKDWHKEIDGILYKKCIDCEEWIIADSEHYNGNKNTKSKLNDRCKTCQTKYQEAYYAKTREKQIEASKRRQRELKEKFPDKQSKYRRKYYLENKDEAAKQVASWYEENKDYKNKYSSDYRKQDYVKLKYKFYNEKHEKHDLYEVEWYNCKLYFNFRCAFCGLPIEEHFVRKGEKVKWEDLQKDHAYHEGKNNLSNCIPLCSDCNNRKKQKTLNQFYNPDNPNYTYERYHKIYLWLRYDYKNYIMPRRKKPRQHLKSLLKEIEKNKLEKAI